MDKEAMVTVPYGDFVDGIKAMADLASIRAILTSGNTVCLDDIKPILGLEVNYKCHT